jgi:hypothetical protein
MLSLCLVLFSSARLLAQCKPLPKYGSPSCLFQCTAVFGPTPGNSHWVAYHMPFNTGHVHFYNGLASETILASCAYSSKSAATCGLTAAVCLCLTGLQTPQQLPTNAAETSCTPVPTTSSQHSSMSANVHIWPPSLPLGLRARQQQGQACSFRSWQQ